LRLNGAQCALMNEPSSNGAAVGLDEAERSKYLRRAARLRVLAEDTKSEAARTLCVQLAESYEKQAGHTSDDAVVTPG
jgi:hypothetical protein